MPRADKAPRLHRDLNRVAAPPRTHRNVPDAIFERLEKKRENGRPHEWTDKHVSKKPEERTKGPSRIDFNDLDKQIVENRERLDALLVEKRAADLARAALPPRPTLEERIAATARPSTEAGPSRIVTQDQLPDFKKLVDKDLRGIYRTRLEAFRKRLLILLELGVKSDNNDSRNFHWLYLKLNNVLRSLDDEPTGYDKGAWLQIHYFCQRSVLISFKSVRKNLPKVLHQVADLYRSGYLDVSQVNL